MHKFYTLHQAPIILNMRHLPLLQAELSAVLSPEMLNENAHFAMKTNILCFPRSASTIGVSSSSTNVPPSFLFFRVLLSQQGIYHQHFQHDYHESQTRLLASSCNPAFISA